MKATSGEHYVALDHVRAVAAMLVFVWHFMHGLHGSPVPFAGVPFWGPLVLFDEGHVGVALFMTLSGYLFAKLLHGKRVIYHLFFWNRALRLMPLLLLVIAVNALKVGLESGHPQAALEYLISIPRGLVFPTWPNGGWSITAELHFYLLLPVLLLLMRRWPHGMWLLLALAILLRTGYHTWTGEVQSLAYPTIIGRIDQFVLGIMAFHGRARFIDRHTQAAVVAAAFITLYWWFDGNGGFYLQPSYPSPSRLWIVLPTLEGAAFAVLIAWYDGSFPHVNGMLSKLFSLLGEYSYSIYLLHFFFVFAVAQWIHANVLDISNFYVALPVSVLAFMTMIPIAYLSMRFVERPFLRLRRRYIMV
jgi:peptidoglycan/LPS O-acetylase OafA/YrhL